MLCYQRLWFKTLKVENILKNTEKLLQNEWMNASKTFNSSVYLTNRLEKPTHKNHQLITLDQHNFNARSKRFIALSVFFSLSASQELQSNSDWVIKITHCKNMKANSLKKYHKQIVCTWETLTHRNRGGERGREAYTKTFSEKENETASFVFKAKKCFWNPFNSLQCWFSKLID